MQTLGPEGWEAVGAKRFRQNGAVYRFLHCSAASPALAPAACDRPQSSFTSSAGEPTLDWPRTENTQVVDRYRPRLIFGIHPVLAMMNL